MEWKILAGVRFFLAWIVFCLHLKWFLPASILVWFGTLDAEAAVLGFLVISGYSIASSITKRPAQFYQRRILRIYPLYAIAILISLLPFKLLHTDNLVFNNLHIFVEPGTVQLTGNLLFLQGFVVSPVRSNPVVWTLSVEVFCYLLAPLLIKTNQKLLATLTLLSAVVFILYPYFFHEDLFFHKYGLPFIALFWAWLLGFLYFLNRDQVLARFGLIGVAAMTLALGHIQDMGEHILPVFTFAIVCTLVMLAPYLRLPKLVLSVFGYLGELSYPFYLVHMPCLLLAYLVFQIRHPAELVAIALLGTALLYHAVDVPLRLRKTAAPKPV